jgi:hypothetical protein
MSKTHRTNQTSIALLVTRTLPPHTTSKTHLRNDLTLARNNLRRIITNHSALSGIIAPARDEIHVIVHRGTRLGKDFVVVHTCFPRSLADARVRRSRTISVGEGTAVQGHAEDDFVERNASGLIVAESLGGVERRGYRGRRGGVEVCLVAGSCVPGAGIVVGHEVPEVEVLIHGAEFHFVVVGGAGGGGDS